jgi:hypothetical protein
MAAAAVTRGIAHGPRLHRNALTRGAGRYGGLGRRSDGCRLAALNADIDQLLEAIRGFDDDLMGAESSPMPERDSSPGILGGLGGTFGTSAKGVIACWLGRTTRRVPIRPDSPEASGLRR